MKVQSRKIENKIYEVRGQKIMFDYDLAKLYSVETRVLNQAVKRNVMRFPKDFMFRLTEREWKELRQQIDITPENKILISQIVISKKQSRGGTQKLPFAFTEQGVAMLSAVLRSVKAVQVSIAIMKAFVFLKQYALSHKDLTDKLKDLETKYNKQFKDVYDAINYLLIKDKQQVEYKERKRIGYK
jgi:hypothetical protein